MTFSNTATNLKDKNETGENGKSSPLLPKKNILGVPITQASFNAVLDWIMTAASAEDPAQRSAYVCLANVHMVMESYRAKTGETGFHSVLANADLAVPDGKPVAIAMNKLYDLQQETRQEQIAGEALMRRLFSRSETEDVSIYFLGATDSVLKRIRDRLSVEHPALRIAGMVSPPFRSLSEAEQAEIIQDINESGAHLVFVALGCPKQEYWMAAHRGKVHAVMLGVGAAFPFYAGEINRAPQWMITCCLEWFYRMCREPKRLFWRYFSTNIPFMMLFAVTLLKKTLKK